MLRFDKVIQPAGFITSRVAYTVILDDQGVYLIQTGSGFPPDGFTRGRGVTKALSQPVIAMRTRKYMADSDRVEQQINEHGYQNFPLGRRGAFFTYSEIESVDFKADAFGSFLVKLKTAKGKFKLSFYSGLHSEASLDQLIYRLSALPN